MHPSPHARRRAARTSLTAAIALLCGAPAMSLAQDQAATAPSAAAPSTVAPSCDGLRVTSIDIRPGRPPFEGSSSRWRNVARAVGLHHQTTKPRVIAAYLSLHVGEECTELRRTESERLVRDQPFLADARVMATPDGAGGVAIVVETIDEIPVLIGGQTRGLNLQSLSLGNSNLGGQGLRAQGYVERGFRYRTGYGARLVEYATFNQPVISTIEAFRHPRGYFGNVEMAHPFYTDLQRGAWRAGWSTSEQYLGVSRPARDPLALVVKQERWDASSIVRAFGTRTVTLLGIGASGLRLTPAAQGIVVMDSGLVADTGITLRNRYRDFRATRVGVLGGIRRVTFHTVRGFDGLTAAQGVATGVMTGLYAGHGIKALGENDQFLSGGIYAGTAASHALLAAVAQVEGRRNPSASPDSSRWDSVIGSGRAALYVGEAPGLVLVVDDRYSSGARSRLPLQLDMSDRIGGILGYRTAALAGARRNAARAELRFSREAVVRNADLGLATFGETGTVWAGDAPYGVSATRATVGFSILAAYPSRSKRLYRADFGFPVTRTGAGAGGIEVRFTSEDRTNNFWREPDDVSRARTGAVPSALFVQPSTR